MPKILDHNVKEPVNAFKEMIPSECVGCNKLQLCLLCSIGAAPNLSQILPLLLSHRHCVTVVTPAGAGFLHADP